VPRFGSIEVDLVKLRDYCLSETHPRGRHKARVFRSRLGLTAGDADFLRQTLLDAVRVHQGDLRATDVDEYGQRYVLDVEMTTATGGTVIVRSVWIALASKDLLRFISCYVL
jgi:hypothetical protein